MRELKLMKVIRVLIADDQRLFAESLKAVFDSLAENIQVVGIATNGREVLEAVRVKKPDLVLMDVRMPVLDGVETTRLLQQEAPEVQVLMLTTYDDDDYVVSSLSQGAVGYLMKDIPAEDLIRSIEAVKEGSVLMSSRIAKRVVRQLSGEFAHRGSHHSDESPPAWLQGLSNREREVISLLADGLNNRQIADRLCIAEQTVKNHISMIYSKLGVHNRYETIKLMAGNSPYGE